VAPEEWIETTVQTGIFVDAASFCLPEGFRLAGQTDPDEDDPAAPWHCIWCRVDDAPDTAILDNGMPAVPIPYFSHEAARPVSTADRAPLGKILAHARPRAPPPVL